MLSTGARLDDIATLRKASFLISPRSRAASRSRPDLCKDFKRDHG